MSCVDLLGEDLGSLCLVSPGLCPISFFFFVNYNLYYFAIINCSHEYNHRFSEVL